MKDHYNKVDPTGEIMSGPKQIIVLCNVFTPTRNAVDLNMHRSNKEYRNTWKNTRIYTWL